MPDDRSPPIDLPARISGIRIGERIRESGPIAVHAGEDSLGLTVRMYLARSAALGGEAGTNDFLARVKLAAHAEHPDLVPFTTGGTKGDIVFAVTKELGARSLDELLGRGGALAVERATGIAVTVAGVLAALEKAGTRHGDLTPRRILLPGRGQVAVRGVRLLPAELQPRRARYQAPEEARGDDGDIRSDIFVLGLILIEMLTGRSPVLGSGADARRAIAAGQLPPAGELAPAAPPALRAVLGRMLAISPDKRYASAEECRLALEAAARGDLPAAGDAEADAPIPTARPLDDDRPETAPIDAADVRAALAAAGPGAPAPPPPAAAPARPAASLPIGKRGPGRLFVESRLGEALVELDEAVYIGWAEGAADVTVSTDAFEGAAIHVTPEPGSDVLEALGGNVTVNGATVANHDLQSGDRISAPNVTGRYERSARGVLRAARMERGTGASGPARAVMAVAVAGTLVVAIFALTRLTAIGEQGDAAETAKRSANDALTAARSDLVSGGGAVGGDAAEAAAKLAYDAARARIRRRPDELEAGRAELRGVATSYPGTTHARLAEMDAESLTRRARGGSEVDELIVAAENDAAEGALDQALRRLRNFAEEHLDTIAAVRAESAAVRIRAEMDARIEADFAKYDAAVDARDYGSALRIVNRMSEYVPRDMKDRVIAARDNVEARMNAVLDGGGTTAGNGAGNGEGPRPPPENPPPRGDPGTENGGGHAGPGDPEAGDPGPDDPVSPPDPAARDEAALTAFRGARRAMDSGKEREALQGFVDFLRTHKGTPTALKYDLEIRKRITSLATGPAGVEEIFRGKVERRERGRFRITYDFEDPDQLLDFRDVNAFAAPPRADWKHTSGSARAKGSGAFMLDAHFKAEFLSVQVEVQPERAHDIGLMFFEAGEVQRYYLYTLQNSFFKLKQDSSEEFRENSIVLFGPDMWRDTPPGQMGFVRKCGSDEPKFRPGEAVTIKCAKAEDEVWMRFPGGRTIRGSAFGDVKYEFKGLSPAFFVLNSAAAFDKMIIEGVPDADWLAQRWAALLQEL